MALVELLLFVTALLIPLIVIRGHSRTTEEEPAGDVPEDLKKANKDASPESVCNKWKPLDGIIARLTRVCGGNVHEKGVVTVTASSGRRLRNAVDLGSNSEFCSKDSPNSWICYDFGGRRMTPTSYSIRSCRDQRGAHPKSWVLEVSNDGSEGLWEVVDSREDNSDLNDSFVTCTFAISAPPSGAFRFVRLRLTGKNHEGNDSLCICALELFGELTDIPRPVAAPGEFPFYDMRPLDGSIAHLTRECGGNVHEKGIVKVTASSCWDGKPENVVDVELNKEFRSNDSRNSWICYDFGGQRMTPTSYSIRSCGWEPGSFHPRSWVLEVSNDGSEGSWEVVDFRENNNELNDKRVTRNFAISAPPSGVFRFVRLRQTGVNHKGNNQLAICALELFGALSSE